jgi:hypothetical protein
MSVCLPARVIRRFTACHAICLFVVITRVASDYRDSRVRLLALIPARYGVGNKQSTTSDPGHRQPIMLLPVPARDWFPVIRCFKEANARVGGNRDSSQQDRTARFGRHGRARANPDRSQRTRLARPLGGAATRRDSGSHDQWSTRPADTPDPDRRAASGCLHVDELLRTVAICP